ncbi:uncharacterized protein AB9X84_016144 [Acanthopagrus schlegelii]
MCPVRLKSILSLHIPPHQRSFTDRGPLLPLPMLLLTVDTLKSLNPQQQLHQWGEAHEAQGDHRARAQTPNSCKLQQKRRKMAKREETHRQKRRAKILMQQQQE